MIVWGGLPPTSTGGLYCARSGCALQEWWRDADGDGYGNPFDHLPSCSQPLGYVAMAGDCDDLNPSVHPGAIETCNGHDDDCNGLVDDGFAPPAGTPVLSVSESAGMTTLAWTNWTGAMGYDVVKGTVTGLQSTLGDFTTATTACVASNSTITSTGDNATLRAGEGFWYLVRARYCGGGGSYDSGSSQQLRSRDVGIQASGVACP